MQKFILLITGLVIPFTLFAQPIPFPTAENSSNADSATAEYLKNFSTYFNIDVEKPVDLPVKSPDVDLIENIGRYVVQNSLINGEQANSSLITSAFRQYQPTLEVSQRPYMNDPTMQALLNFITTPNTADDCFEEKGCITGLLINNYFSNQIGLSKPFEFNNANQLVKRNDEKINLANMALSLNALLGPLNYQLSPPTNQRRGSSSGASNRGQEQGIDQQKNAERFVQLSTGQASPLRLPTLEKMQQLIRNQENLPQINEFLTKLYTYVSLNSVAISNLNEMYAKRVPNDRLGNLSQTQVEYQMAMRRMSGPINPSNPSGDTWLKAMEEASPIVVQREMLYLLAEMNYQMYLSRMQNERVLATLSAIQIQNMEALRGQLFLN